MAREGKMSPFSKMVNNAIKEAGLEIHSEKDYIFKVEVEVLRHVSHSSIDYELGLCKEHDTFTVTGTSQSIDAILFNSNVIEHPYALTSRIKKEVYGEPIYTILSCEVIK